MKFPIPLIANVFVLLLIALISLQLGVLIGEQRPTPCPACLQPTSVPVRTPPPSATAYVPVPCQEIVIRKVPDMAEIEKDLALVYIELEKAYGYGHLLYTSVPGQFNWQVAVTVNHIGAAMERVEGVGKQIELWSAMGTFECWE